MPGARFVALQTKGRNRLDDFALETRSRSTGIGAGGSARLRHHRRAALSVERRVPGVPGRSGLPHARLGAGRADVRQQRLPPGRFDRHAGGARRLAARRLRHALRPGHRPHRACGGQATREPRGAHRVLRLPALQHPRQLRLRPDRRMAVGVHQRLERHARRDARLRPGGSGRDATPRERRRHSSIASTPPLPTASRRIGASGAAPRPRRASAPGTARKRRRTGAACVSASTTSRRWATRSASNGAKPAAMRR